MKSFLIFISIIYISLSNIYCLANELEQDKNTLKIGLIIPLSGEHQEIGKSVLNSIRLALSKINDAKIEIYPKDNFSNPEKTLFVANQLKEEGIKLIIGPIFSENLIYLNEVENLIFLSLSNKTKSVPKNVISIGVNANSQISTIITFLKKRDLRKTIVLIPRADYEDEFKSALSKTKHKFSKIYSYDTEPGKLTSQIEQITSYSQRKKRLERRIKILEKSDDPTSKKKLEKLKKKYTLGEINFDSVIIADFGENLKSVTNSFLFSDVTTKNVKFITLNQWFDENLLNENSMNEIYFPSINYKNFSKFNKSYFKIYNNYPSKISILSYDILGLIYYVYKKNEGNMNANLFKDKDIYKGEIGSFIFTKNEITHNLDIYQILNGQFSKVK